MNTRDFTLNDIHVGSRLYGALVKHARETQGKPVVYSDLLRMARELYPEDTELGNAVPIGIGMKLLFVQEFCEANDYPNLACLAVNKATMLPGPGYKGEWERDKRAVGAFDWTQAAHHLDAFIIHAKRAVAKRKRINKEEAAEVLYQNFQVHRGKYEFFTQDDKQEMMNLLMEGFDADTAFKHVFEERLTSAEC